MKQFIFLMAFACTSMSVFAQENKMETPISVDGLVAKHTNTSLQISWQSKTSDSNYWEVQGSTNGKDFSTIGLVMGADPKGSKGSFCFKQQSEKIKPGLKYFRVICIENEEVGYASSPISLTK